MRSSPPTKSVSLRRLPTDRTAGRRTRSPEKLDRRDRWQSKVTQIVCLKLHLKPIRRSSSAVQRHYACIVDEQIERLSGLHPRPAKSAIDARIKGLVLIRAPSTSRLILSAAVCPFRLLRPGQNDLRLGLGQCESGVVTETGRGTLTTADLPYCEVISACEATITDPWLSLLPDQRDLQVSGPVLLGIEAATVDIASAPE